MKFNKIIIPFLILSCTIFFIQCKRNNQNYNEEQNGNYSTEDGYADGTYCAEVKYYYSETGTNSTYTLEVEIENNELTVIHWPNGGWLDNSHFRPPDISSGEATFTSDRGVDYTVKITGNGGDCSTSSYATDEDDLIQQKDEEEYRKRQDEEDDYKKKQDEEDEYRKKQEQEDEDREAEEERRKQEQNDE